jgi:hypothetical protein
VHCPLCEYNLRGLIEPRCPECGYRFDWPELLDPTKRLHPYLFEHHPERKFRAFRQTLVGGLLPRRFWKSLLPIQPTFPRRLLAYWLAAAVAYLVLAAASFVPAAVWEAKHISTLRPIAAAALNNPANGQYKQRIIDEYGSVQAYLDLMYPTHLLPSLVLQRLVAPEFVMPSLVLLAWPWMTFATLMIFRISMRRARVRTIHVLRCVLYTYDLAVWIGLACLVAMTVRYALTSTCNPDDWIDTILLVIEAGLILAFYRLWMAYRLHRK